MKIWTLLFFAAVFSTDKISSKDHEAIAEQNLVAPILPSTRRRLMRGFLIAFGGLFAVVILALLAILFVPFIQRIPIYLHLDPRPYIDWDHPGIPVQSRFQIASHEGIQNVEIVRTLERNLFGWFMAASTRSAWSKYSVLYFHGNSGHIGRYYRVKAYKLMNKLGMNVFAWDYTGFGKNAGKPSEENIGKDGHDFFKTSLSKLKPDEKIILWGHSLGTGAIFQLLRRLDPEQFSKIHAVILEAPFISILDVVHDNYLPKFLQGPTAKKILSNCLKDHINSYEVVKSLKKLPFKVLILHSTGDDDVPFRHGKVMQAALEQKTAVTFKEIDSNTHNEITLRKDFPETLENFLKNSEE